MPQYPYVIGDVFLFEADDSCIAQLICALSDSPVSHAAVYCGEGRILEAGLPTVGSRTLAQLGTDRPIHIMGHRTPEIVAAALSPVLRRQSVSQEPYSMGNLITVGLLLAGKSHLKKLPKVVLLLMRHICAEIAHFIDAKKHPGRHPMTCSQFVYHCYLEAGIPLKLDPVATQRGFAGPAITPDSLLTYVLDSGWQIPDAKATRESLLEEGTTDRSLPGKDDIMEKLCCVVLNTMFAAKRDMDTDDRTLTEADADELACQAAVFGSLILELGLDEATLPARTAARGGARERLNVIYEEFISPGDFLLHCPDLAEKAVINKK